MQGREAYPSPPACSWPSVGLCRVIGCPGTAAARLPCLWRIPGRPVRVIRGLRVVPLALSIAGCSGSGGAGIHCIPLCLRPDAVLAHLRGIDLDRFRWLRCQCVASVLRWLGAAGWPLDLEPSRLVCQRTRLARVRRPRRRQAVTTLMQSLCQWSSEHTTVRFKGIRTHS